MDKLVFKINKNILSVSILKNDTKPEDLNNTNIIDTKELVFSKIYILENLELVSSFLNVVILKKEVSKVIVKDYEIMSLIIKLVNNIPAIKCLSLKPDKIIDYKIFMDLLENRTLKEIDVYDIPKYLLERLDVNKDLIVNVRSEMFFISDFMNDNNLYTYSDLYYKKSIYVYENFTKNDFEDFNTFLTINNYLKSINIVTYSKKVIEFVIESLIANNESDIRIIINEENNDLKEIYKDINNIKTKYEKYFKEKNITFKMNYSLEFKKNNFLKQLNLNFIKISILLVIVLVLTLMGINYYKNYSQAQDIKNIESEIKNLIKRIDEEYDMDEQDTDVEYIDNDDLPEDTTVKTTKSNYVSSYYKNYEKVFDTLLKLNSDTKGWLTVNNTRIDYPVVQAKDNDYYLKRDYNGYKNSMGWIFMDYRNSIDVLNQNTIIYGHNITDGIMFGTLRYALNSSWYTKTANQIITFNTLNAALSWQIISIYKIPNTTDYITTTFYDTSEYQNFLDLIVGRSIYNFNQTVGTSDKILTLSTCQNRGQERLVVHAKLIANE